MQSEDGKPVLGSSSKRDHVARNYTFPLSDYMQNVNRTNRRHAPMDWKKKREYLSLTVKIYWNSSFFSFLFSL